MAFNDLMQALNNLNQGATELAVGRATRQAAEQAQMINMNEQDEFKKRQAFTQLGQGLAAQLSSLGASPAQVQQMSQNFMPQALQSPVDFFAASATASSPQGAQQYKQAGQQIQNNIAAAPLTTMQNEQLKIQKMQLLNERINAQNAKKPPIKTLPESQITKISGLEDQLATMQDLYTQVKADPGLVGIGNIVTDTFGLRGALDPKFAAFKATVLKNFDAYRQQVTGAGASIPELKDLMKRQPQPTDTQEEFLAKARAAIEIGEKVRKRQLVNLGKAGYDMSNFSANPITQLGENKNVSDSNNQIPAGVKSQLEGLSLKFNSMDSEQQKRVQSIIQAVKERQGQ